MKKSQAYYYQSLAAPSMTNWANIFTGLLFYAYVAINQERRSLTIIKGVQCFWTIYLDSTDGIFDLITFILQRVDNVSAAGHGYDNDDMTMKSLFYAQGPSFRHGYLANHFESVRIFRESSSVHHGLMLTILTRTRAGRPLVDYCSRPLFGTSLRTMISSLVPKTCTMLTCGKRKGEPVTLKWKRGRQWLTRLPN